MAAVMCEMDEFLSQKNPDFRPLFVEHDLRQIER